MGFGIGRRTGGLCTWHMTTFILPVAQLVAVYDDVLLPFICPHSRLFPQVQTPWSAQTDFHLAHICLQNTPLLLHHTCNSANMFRRVEATLEPDPSFPADLKQLG